MPDQQKQSQSGSPFEIVTTSKSKKLTPKNLIIIGMALVFLSVSIFLGVYLVGKRTNISEKASPATAMYITPGSQTKAPGANFSFTVDMDTSTNAVTGVDVRLIFNPNVMQVLSLQQGTGVTNLNQTISNTYDNTAGTITYAVFTLDSSKAITGSSIKVLTVNAAVKSGAAVGSNNISFDPATAASASQEGQNVLISKSQGVIVISGSGTTAPTATATTHATATATATATTRATATASSRATSTAVATATAHATATAAPTDSGNSCGGTCGSNSNCQSNYMCYQGYCRNPNCPNETSCGCSSTSSTAAPTSVAKATSMPIPVTGTDWPTFMAIGVGIFTIIASIILAI